MNIGQNLPNPGTKFAKVMGCTCSEAENKMGYGHYHNTLTGDIEFILDEKCPVHGFLLNLGSWQNICD